MNTLNGYTTRTFYTTAAENIIGHLRKIRKFKKDSQSLMTLPLFLKKGEHYLKKDFRSKNVISDDREIYQKYIFLRMKLCFMYYQSIVS